MGYDKASLLIHGKSFINLISHELSFCKSVLLSASSNANNFGMDIPIVVDLWSDKGPLSGVCSALYKCSTELAVVVACDMPFFSQSLGKMLVDGLKEYDAVVPQTADGQIHPLCACYRHCLASKMKTCIDKNQLRFKSFLETIDVLYLPVSNSYLFSNINYPSDYSRLFATENP